MPAQHGHPQQAQQWCTFHLSALGSFVARLPAAAAGGSSAGAALRSTMPSALLTSSTRADSGAATAGLVSPSYASGIMMFRH